MAVSHFFLDGKHKQKMNPIAATQNKKKKPTDDLDKVYVKNVISMKVPLKMNEIGGTNSEGGGPSTRQNLLHKIVRQVENKCIPEGYVRPNSVEIISYSSGVIKHNVVEFQVVFWCWVCNPMEGMKVECLVKTITKAGIHAEVVADSHVPIKIFVARDHNYNGEEFQNVQENETIVVQIIGKRFELNDPHVVAIASYVPPTSKGSKRKRSEDVNQDEDENDT